MEILAQQEFKKDNIKLNEKIVKEIYDLKGNPIEFESENKNKCYIIKYLDKKLEFLMDNSPVICIFSRRNRSTPAKALKYRSNDYKR